MALYARPGNDDGKLNNVLHWNQPVPSSSLSRVFFPLDGPSEADGLHAPFEVAPAPVADEDAAQRRLPFERPLSFVDEEVEAAPSLPLVDRPGVLPLARSTSVRPPRSTTGPMMPDGNCKPSYRFAVEFVTSTSSRIVRRRTIPSTGNTYGSQARTPIRFPFRDTSAMSPSLPPRASVPSTAARSEARARDR